MITKIAYVTRAKMGMKVTGKRMYKSSQLIFLSLLNNRIQRNPLRLFCIPAFFFDV